MPRAPFGVKSPPLETQILRRALKDFFSSPWPGGDRTITVGSFKWGVYIFYDYDGEPIYVGQTNEKISGRIGRHLTNQRTDAVAMSVLDPFEVAEIEVFPLTDYQGVTAKSANYRLAKQHLDALEYAVHQIAIERSQFKAILNEKDPPAPGSPVAIPPSFRGSIVTAPIREWRDHPDTRIARRAATIARLTQRIAERQPNIGLRRALVVQAERLTWLARKRFDALGGKAAVPIGVSGDDAENESAG